MSRDDEFSVGKVILITLLVIAGIGATGYVFGWFGETAQVTQEQFGPKALLKKYEWFKDAAAQLDAKRANIEVLEGRLTTMKETYGDTPRKDWPRADLEQFNVWSSEVSGAKAGYNLLAAEYNSQMAKANWRFANAGDLPAGAADPLPRAFKPYVTK
jgi:hypothetical protein